MGITDWASVGNCVGGTAEFRLLFLDLLLSGMASRVSTSREHLKGVHRLHSAELDSSSVCTDSFKKVCAQ